MSIIAFLNSPTAQQIGSFLGNYVQTILGLGGLGFLVKYVNCHTPGCWRIGLHHMKDTPYKVCRKHHPDIPNKLTLKHMEDHYQNEKEKNV